MTSPLPAITPETLEAAARAVRSTTAEVGPDGIPLPWTSHDSHSYNASCIVCRGDVAAIIAAAVPVLLSEHEKQVREKCAAELRAWADEIPNPGITGPRATRRRTLTSAASKLLPKLTPAELAQKIASGQVQVIHCTALDIDSPGSRLSDSKETPS